MSKSDYEILGLSIGCSKEQIKKRYLKLMLKYHPDKAGDKYVDKYKEINNAYSNLMKDLFKEDAMIPTKFREMGFDKIPTLHEYVRAKMQQTAPLSIVDMIKYYLFDSSELILSK